MGVSIEVWRARIGLFVGVMRSKSCLQRVWPHGRRRRTYQVPLKPPRKHHVPILICLLTLAFLSAIDGQDPGQTFRHGGRGCVVMISAAAWFTGTCFLEIEKWRNRLTLGLLILLVSLILTCGDVESNPGPEGAKPKMTYKVRLEETGQQFGTSASSMADIRGRISRKWDITSDDYILCEEDGTELEDDDYFQGLPNGSVVIVRCKSAEQNDDHQYSRPKKHRPVPLTDEMIHDIAVSHLSLDDVRPLGFKMGFNHTEIQKYERENSSDENLVRSRGTESMIHHWIKGHSQRNNVDAFCHVLRESGLHELADQIESGVPLTVQRPTISSDVLDLRNLQHELRLHYCHRLCYMKMIPWREDSACSVEDYFIPLSLVRRMKVPRRANPDTGKFDHSEYSATTSLHNLLQFPGYRFTDDYLCGSHVTKPVSHDDIFKLRENGEICHRILVSGKPGIGKSTLASKLAYDWVNRVDQSPSQNVPLLFVLSLSSLDIDSDIGEEIVKQLLPDDTTTTASQINQYIETHQKDVVLIFDGLDESVLLNQSLNKTKRVGNIMKSVKYDALRSCKILVTTRPWMEDELLGNLFTVYEHIQINGFRMNSIEEFVDNYCQSSTRLAEKVKEKIFIDLLNLNHLFHVPLFLVMLCEMVRAEIDIGPCDTLTSFIQQVCIYLFTSYNVKPNCKSFFQNPSVNNEMHECLRALGEIAIQGKTTSDDVQLERGLAVGLLSRKSVVGDQKIKGLEIPEKSTVFYFCHGLLKDFCISHYLLSLLESNLNSIIKDSLCGFGVLINRYVLLFLCGLNQSVVVMIFNHLSEAKLQNDIYTEFSVQCYFEGKISNKGVNMDIFSFAKRLVIDICRLNSFQAAKYLLSNSRSNSFGFKQLHMFGENIADSNNGDAAHSMTPFVLNPDRLSDIYVRCSNLTKIGLYDLMFLEVAFQEETKLIRSNFKLALISVLFCRDEALLENLLKTMMFHLPTLEQIEMVNIGNPHSVSKCKQIGIEFLFNFFAKFSCPLNLVRGHCIKRSKHAYDRGSKEWPLVKVASLWKCGYAIPFHQTIGLLGRRCPLLTILEINFSTSHHRCLNTQTNKPSADCISFKKIVSLISVHCPNVEDLELVNYNFDFKEGLQNFIKRRKFPIKSIRLTHCKQLVHLSHILYFFSYNFPSLNFLFISTPKISFEDTVRLPAAPGPYQSLENIHLSDLKDPVDIMHIMDVLCNYCPSVRLLMVENCEVNFELVKSSPVPESYCALKYLILANLTQPVDLVRVIYHLYRHCLTLCIHDSELVDEDISDYKMTAANSKRCLESVMLHQCKMSIHLARTFHLLGYLIPTSLNFAVQGCDINLLRISDFKETISHLTNNDLTLIQCVNPVCLACILDALCHCCPSINMLFIQESEIILQGAHFCTECISHDTLVVLFLSDCKTPVNIPSIIDLLCHYCPSLRYLRISDSEISLEDEHPSTAKRLHQALEAIELSHVNPNNVGHARKLLRGRCPSLVKTTINGSTTLTRSKKYTIVVFAVIVIAVILVFAVIVIAVIGMFSDFFSDLLERCLLSYLLLASMEKDLLTSCNNLSAVAIIIIIISVVTLLTGCDILSAVIVALSVIKLLTSFDFHR